MRIATFSAAALATLLRQQTIADMSELQQALGRPARRTVFRKLGELSYRSSYSHRGRYYTLDELAHFDADGLWSVDGVWFSVHGTLLNTAEAWVTQAEAGYTVAELDQALHVGTQDALRRLTKQGRLHRVRIDGTRVYFSADAEQRRLQRQARQLLGSRPEAVGALPQAATLSAELGAAMVLFFSLLDEQQRRLYAGLESLKVGYGGDRRIAELLGLDVNTVGRGRHQLLNQDIDLARTRRLGGGRKTTEQKRRTSSHTSKH